jgi:penicillin-binding protein 2
VRNPILAGLEGVVENPHGTAYGAFHSIVKFSLASYPIAGKTGTATTSIRLEPNSWFVGFGPATRPEYVVLCVVAQGGYGADAAAPVVAQAFNYLVAHPVKPVTLKPQLTVPSKKKSSTSTTTTTLSHG